MSRTASARALLVLTVVSACAGGHSSFRVGASPGAAPSTTTPAFGQGSTTLASPETVSTPPPSGSTAPAATAALATAPATAPRVVSITVDAAAEHAAVTFDQPVVSGAASLAPLYLVVYGNQPACSTPEGNGQAPVSGGGTKVLSLPATSLVLGVNYVTIASGFATSLGGTPNVAVGCTAVRSATAPIPPTTTTLPFNAPAVVRTVMDPSAGTVTVTFDQPVAGGQPMYLVVYEGDATCATPNGNGHAFLSGSGTPTVTASASSLVAGTTYITIASGWVMSTNAAAIPNKPLGCTAVHAA